MLRRRKNGQMFHRGNLAALLIQVKRNWSLFFTKSRFDVLTPKEGKEVTVYEKEEQEEDDQHDKLQDKEVIHRRVLPREFKINHRYLIAKA